jgi:hypothetical protein
MTRYVIGPDVAMRSARDRGVSGVTGLVTAAPIEAPT